MLTSRRFHAVLTTLLVAGCALVPAVAAADTVPVGEAPALPAGATANGPVDSQLPLEVFVALEPRDPEALRTYAEEVATPGSPNYGRYLSVPEFAQRFGATPGAIATVRRSLEARGLTVGSVPGNHLSLPVEATATEAEAAFDTEIESIETAEGEPGYISSSAPEVAEAAAPFVTGVLGLDNLAQPRRRRAAEDANPLAPRLGGTAAVHAAAGPGPQPCAAASATAVANPTESLGYTADQFAAAYDFDKLYAAGNFGAGQSIGLYEEEPFKPSDIDAFQQCYGTHASIETVEIGSNIEPGEKEQGEATLDVEQAIQLAPEAHLVVYRTGGGTGSEAEILSKWVTENRAKVMSSSYGICEKLYEAGKAGMATTDTLLQEAAVQGQTFVVASGDFGAADCSQQDSKDKAAAVDYPGSDPFATDVGGTRLEEPTAAAPHEYLWNDAPNWGAGGGGISAHFPMPSYQRDSDPSLHVINALSTGATCGFAGYCRQVPDVAADASAETGYVIYYHGGWEVTGGTSAAAPLWAALTALTNASPACGGRSVGFLNPSVYSLAGSDYATNFRDIVEAKPGGPVTNNRDEPGKPFPAGPGYDMATGIGVPIGDQLAASLCGIVNPPAPPVPPVPPAPVPAPETSATKPSPAPAPAPTPAKLKASRLAGVAKGAPTLTLGLEARQGANLEVVTVALPPGLEAAKAKKALASGIVARAGGKRLKIAARLVGKRIQITLRSPNPAVFLQIKAPALTVSTKLQERAKAGQKKKLSVVVTTRESGNQSSRFPLALPL